MKDQSGEPQSWNECPDGEQKDAMLQRDVTQRIEATRDTRGRDDDRADGKQKDSLMELLTNCPP